MRASRCFVLVFATLSFGLAAIPAQAQDNCAPLRIITTIDILRDMDSGAWGIPVLIGERRAVFQIATAGLQSSISAALVDELGLPTGASGVWLIDATGRRFQPSMVRIPTIILGTLKGDQLPFLVEQDQGPDGIIATEILRNYDLELDFNAGKFRMIDPSHCDGRVIHWQADTVAVAPMRIQAESGRIYVPVTVNGVRLEAMIDLARSDSVINLDIARRRLDVDINSPEVREVGELQGPSYSAKIYETNLDTLQIEGVTVTQPLVTLMPDMIRGRISEAPPAGSLIAPPRETRLQEVILGMSVLRHLHVYISYRERKMYVTSPSPLTP